MRTQRMALEVCERCQNWRVLTARLGGKAMAGTAEKVSIHPNQMKALMGTLEGFDNDELRIIRDYINAMLGN